MTKGFAYGAVVAALTFNLASCSQSKSGGEDGSLLQGTTQGPYITVAQARSAFSNAGFSGDVLTTVVAVAQCESTLGTKSFAFSRGNRHTGIMQISDLHKELCGFSDSSVEAFRSQMENAYANAACAYTLYSSRGGTLNDWDCYRFGSYQQFMGASSGSGGGDEINYQQTEQRVSCNLTLTDSSTGKSQYYQIDKSQVPTYKQKAMELGWPASAISVSPAACN